MSLRKAIVLLLLAAFSFTTVLPASAVGTIAQTNPVDGVQNPPQAFSSRFTFRDTTSNTRVPANLYLSFNSGETRFSDIDAGFANADTVEIEANGAPLTTGSGVGVTTPRLIVLPPPTGYRWQANRLNRGDTATFVDVTMDQLSVNVEFDTTVTGIVPTGALIARILTAATPSPTVYGPAATSAVKTGDLLIGFFPTATGQPSNTGSYGIRITGFDLVSLRGSSAAADTFITSPLTDLSTIVFNGGTADNALTPFSSLSVPSGIDRGGPSGASEISTIVNSGHFLVNPADTSIIVADGVTTFKFGVDLNTNKTVGDVHIPQLVWQGVRDPGSAAAGNSFTDTRNVSPGAYPADPFLDSPIVVPGGPLTGAVDNAAIRAIQLDNAAVFTNQSALARLNVRVVDPDTGIDIPGATVSIQSASLHIMSSDRANNLHGLLPDGAGDIGDPATGTITFGGNNGITTDSVNLPELMGNLGVGIVGIPCSAGDECGTVGFSPNLAGTSYIFSDGTNFATPDAAGAQFTTEVGRIAGTAAQFPNPMAPFVVDNFSFDSADPTNRISFFSPGDVPGIFTNELAGIAPGTGASTNNEPATDANNPSANRTTGTSLAEIVGLGTAGAADSMFDIPGTMTFLEGAGAPGFLLGCGAESGGALVLTGCGLDDTTPTEANYGTQLITVSSTGAATDFDANVILAGQISGTEIRLVPVNTYGFMNQGFNSTGTVDGGGAAIVIRPNIMVSNVPSGTAFNLVVDSTGNTLDGSQTLLAQVIPAGSATVNLDSMVYPGSCTKGTLLVQTIGTTPETPVSTAGYREADPTAVGASVECLDDLLGVTEEFDPNLPPAFVGTEGTCTGPVTNLRVVIQETVPGEFATLDPRFGPDTMIGIFLDDRLDLIGTDPAVMGTLVTSDGLVFTVDSVLPRTNDRGAVILLDFVSEAPTLPNAKGVLLYEIEHPRVKMVGDSSTLGTGNFTADVFVVNDAAEPEKLAQVGSTLTLAENYQACLFECAVAPASDALNLIFDGGLPDADPFTYVGRIAGGAFPQEFPAPDSLLIRAVGAGALDFVVPITCSVGPNMFTSVVGPPIKLNKSILDSTTFVPSTLASPTAGIVPLGLGDTSGSNPWSVPSSPNLFSWVNSGGGGQFQVGALGGTSFLGGATIPVEASADPDSNGGDVTFGLMLTGPSDLAEVASIARLAPLGVREATVPGTFEALGGLSGLTTSTLNPAAGPVGNTSVFAPTDAEFPLFVQDKTGVLIANQINAAFDNSTAADNLYLSGTDNLADLLKSIAQGRNATLVKPVTQAAIEGNLNIELFPAVVEAGSDALPGNEVCVTALDNVFEPNSIVTFTNTSASPVDVVQVVAGPNGSTVAKFRGDDGDRIVVTGIVGSAEFTATDTLVEPRILVAPVPTEMASFPLPNRGAFILLIDVDDIIAVGFDPTEDPEGYSVDGEPVDVLEAGGQTFLAVRVKASKSAYTLSRIVQDSEGNDVEVSATVSGIVKFTAKQGGGFGSKLNVVERLVSGLYRLRVQQGKSIPGESKLTVLILSEDTGEVISVIEDKINSRAVVIDNIPQSEVFMLIGPRNSASRIGINKTKNN